MQSQPISLPLITDDNDEFMFFSLYFLYIQIYRWASTLSWPICAGVRKVRAPKQEQVLFMLHPNPYVFYIYVYINREREREQ